MELTTSLRLCREHNACGAPESTLSGNQYRLLVAALGSHWDDDQPIPLLTLLDLNAGPGWTGADNALWALQAVPDEQVQASSRVAANFSIQLLGAISGSPACAWAIRVLKKFADGRATRGEAKAAAQDAWRSESAGAKISRAWISWATNHTTIGEWAAWAAWTTMGALGAGVPHATAILRFLLEFEAAE